MNKNQKLNLLFDASILTHFQEKNSTRAGIFFVAYNVLQEFERRKLFNITLYIRHDKQKKLRFMKNDDFFSKFNYIIFYDKDLFLDNIKILKKQIKYEKSSLQKMVRFLKITKNYLRIIKYQMKILYRHKINKLTEKMNIAFSSDSYIPHEIEKNKHIKKYIFLHDTIPLLFPNYYSNFFSTDDHINEFANNKNLHYEYYYFCNSECTKRDFIKFYPTKLDENKLIVTYVATSKTFYPDYNKPKLKNLFTKYNIQHNEKYLFSLGRFDPRKNLVFTVHCFIKFIRKHQIQDLFFYIGGSDWHFFIREFEEKIKDFSEYKTKIIRLGYIDDEDINTLYSNSLFFVFISEYEGFGMPVIEAMQAGTPVITSNNSSLSEVAGDAAIQIDYDSEEQCIKAFEDLYFNDSLREHYIQKGLERAKYFSWEKTVDIISENMLNS